MCVCACVFNTDIVHEALEKDALEAKKKRWLSFYDQKTGGIMGMLPLVRGLPVRLTDHIHRNKGLCKNTKCTIHSWKLNKHEASLACYALLIVSFLSRSRTCSVVCILAGVCGWCV